MPVGRLAQDHLNFLLCQLTVYLCLTCLYVLPGTNNTPAITEVIGSSGDPQQPPTCLETGPPATTATRTQDPDLVDEEDFVHDQDLVDASEDDDDCGTGGEESARTGNAQLRQLCGQTVTLSATRPHITWTVIPETADNSQAERQQQHFRLQLGLSGGLPVKQNGEPDLLALWLKLYPGSIDDDLERVNKAGLQQRHSFKSVSAQEWICFWGLVLAARQFHVKGKNLWTEADNQGEH